MGLFIKGASIVAPSSFSIDINGQPPANNGAGPYLIGLEYWTDVFDAAAGGFLVKLEYDAPDGLLYQLGGINVPLAGGPPAYQSIPLSPVSRANATGVFRIVGTLSGPAGTSAVSWRVWILPGASTDLIGW